MTDIREMTDVRELDPVEMAGVLGGDGVPITQLGPDYTDCLVFPPKPVVHYIM
jgi:hypothetical protein